MAAVAAFLQVIEYSHQAKSLLGKLKQTNYFIAFVGTPSLTGTWQLQFTMVMGLVLEVKRTRVRASGKQRGRARLAVSKYVPVGSRLPGPVSWSR